MMVSVRLAVAEKRQHVHGVWLQRKDEVSYERYKEKRNQAKRVVRVAEVRVDERWGRNNKMLWKEVHRIRKETSEN